MFTLDKHTLKSTLGALRTAIHHAEQQHVVAANAWLHWGAPLAAIDDAGGQPVAAPAPSMVARALAAAQRLGQAALNAPAARSARRAQTYLAIYPAGSGR